MIYAIRDRCLCTHKPMAENGIVESMIPFKGKFA